MISFLASFLAGLVGKIAETFVGWFAPYRQGRNAERAAQAEGAARQASDVANAQAAARDIVIDDRWLHGRNPPDKAPTVPGPDGTPRAD